MCSSLYQRSNSSSCSAAISQYTMSKPSPFFAAILSLLLAGGCTRVDMVTGASMSHSDAPPQIDHDAWCLAQDERICQCPLMARLGLVHLGPNRIDDRPDIGIKIRLGEG